MVESGYDSSIKIHECHYIENAFINAGVANISHPFENSEKSMDPSISKTFWKIKNIYFD